MQYLKVIFKSGNFKTSKILFLHILTILIFKNISQKGFVKIQIIFKALVVIVSLQLRLFSFNLKF